MIICYSKNRKFMHTHAINILTKCHPVVKKKILIPLPYGKLNFINHQFLKINLWFYYVHNAPLSFPAKTGDEQLLKKKSLEAPQKINEPHSYYLGYNQRL